MKTQIGIGKNQRTKNVSWKSSGFECENRMGESKGRMKWAEEVTPLGVNTKMSDGESLLKLNTQDKTICEI